ncbi:NitT/TauT family transport system substrate-binding protein [Ruminococcus flavefaciens]|uniref:NitT/TauT family transport system substrate-binding protein n=1 Tax=Ruminococcus flavefaciens TaxID=1265 RepID=A0A1H6KHC9_RUMFL|nr:ABC transporter substrate-binding protein [Ruminococcus flavefaciens]SEH72999.1 NitT/TauT family transport system substrate-binding protein [Ruminococcus flavefaciens]
MNKFKIVSALAALSLLTGCGAFNNNSQSSETNTEAKTAVQPDASAAEETKDCCEDKDKDCCKDGVADCCGDSAEAVLGKPEKTDINIGYLNSTAHLLAFVAQEEGYFKEEGLKVTLTQFSSAAELVNGLESDKLDVAFIGSVPTLTFQSQGHDVSIFGGAMTNGHGYVIKSQFADKDELGVEILKGRNVASVKNSVQDAELQILLKDAGIEIGEGKDKVNIVYFDSQKDAYAALLNDTIDAASVYSPYASLAKSQGYKVVYYCAHEKALENQPCCRQVAKTSALSSSPNTYTAIERAFIKAYHFTQSDHDKTIKDVKKYIDIEEEFIDTEVYGGYSVSSPDPDKQGTLTLKDTIIELGYTNDYDIEPYYNTEIYKNALNSILAENSDDIYKSLEEHFNDYE